MPPFHTILLPLSDEEKKIAADIEEKLNKIQRLYSYDRKRVEEILQLQLIEIFKKSVTILVRLTDNYPRIAAFCRTDPELLRTWAAFLSRVLSCEARPQKNLNFLDWVMGIIYYLAYEAIERSEDIDPITKICDSYSCLKKAHMLGYFRATLEYEKKYFEHMQTYMYESKPTKINAQELLRVPLQTTKTHPTPGYFLLAIAYMHLGRYYRNICVEIENNLYRKLRKLQVDYRNTLRDEGQQEPRESASIVAAGERAYANLSWQKTLLIKAMLKCYELAVMYCHVAIKLEPYNTDAIYTAFSGLNMFAEMSKLFPSQPTGVANFSNWSQVFSFFKTEQQRNQKHFPCLILMERKSTLNAQEEAEKFITRKFNNPPSVITPPESPRNDSSSGSCVTDENEDIQLLFPGSSPVQPGEDPLSCNIK